jgi:hypothetical protein
VGAGERDPLEVVLPAPTIRRLSQAQYGRAIYDLFGEDIVLPTSLEPDETIDGLQAIGSALTTISPRGVEQYEQAAYDIAGQALDTKRERQALIPCLDDTDFADPCIERFFREFGIRVWRRPLTDLEVDRLTGISLRAGGLLGDPYDGLEFGLAALLQSPHFLFRVELGEPDPDEPGTVRFTDYEMASRLSFFLWDTIPDEALLAAAARGELVDDEALSGHVDRMVEDDRVEQGLRALFTDMLGLYALDDLNKDPTIFTHMSPEVGPAAREETLLGILHLVREQDGDYRELFTTRTTFLDRRLASIYGVSAPAWDGFGMTEWPEEHGRRGLLGQVSFLAGHSHPVASSPTLRGKFVRRTLLCHVIPPPPSNVDASIPEPAEGRVTMRDRVAKHLEDPYCAGCHSLVDPIGLGLENFDGLGHWRDREYGEQIDASGELDGGDFSDAWDLSRQVSEHPDLPGCLARTMLSYASGRSLLEGEEDAVRYHDEGFEAGDYSVTALLRDVALSPAFRNTGGVQ